MRNILELASWAPSGDNSQPWRFEILGDSTARIHGYDMSTSRVYDYQGNYSQFALGCLLETLEIAATSFSHPLHL
ncbi:MAG: nitroreductase family protein, partial [Parachlamydia sp.]|nr:nitroreductase family protein [Parachlamydia sp.]